VETKIHAKTTAEGQRLRDNRERRAPWKKWGPYLSERQWGTVREDYSESGNAWSYVTHDQARSRAYHWGEDGIAGISDDRQQLCFALALWNEQDAILKERLFGLSNPEGNHGEDVKEYYFYLDNTPTHSYMKYSYKYPQSAYPYLDLVQTNRARTRNDFEYELLDTGAFNENRYFDVLIEYAKATPEELLIKITVSNRGSDTKRLHVLPTLWFRNTWSWVSDVPRPGLRQVSGRPGERVIEATGTDLGARYLYCEGEVPLLFTENETNNRRLFGTENATPYVKDGINNYVVNGEAGAVNPANTGTKAAPHYQIEVAAGQDCVLRLRLCDVGPGGKGSVRLPEEFESIVRTRQKEADEFYGAIRPPTTGDDEARVMRQALAGMLWSKQFYALDVYRWLEEHPGHKAPRNESWVHMINADIISMPDKWEYPWYAAWDLAFHAVALSTVDVDFAQEQLDLMLRALYLHPNGQIPAYEWNFSDVNPPVHAWATMFVYEMQKRIYGRGDVEFLKRTFNKLTANFTWWVNRKDRFGRNVFEGGFLGLDNIGVFDRSAPLPTGGYLEQADGTAWMVMYCQNMLEMATELAAYDPVYDELATKYVDHFLLIASALNRAGTGLWDEEDGFYYDMLRLPDGQSVPLRIRSIVGLLPLCATAVIEKYERERIPRLMEHAQRRIHQKPDLMNSIHPTGPGNFGVADRGILALVNPDRLRRILARMLDENEFLSPYGIRSLSRFHADHPYTFSVQGQEYRVDYLPAESNSGMFGGNSNWRGPIWFPINALIIRALLQFYLYYGDNLKVECPTGSGHMMNLYEVAHEIQARLSRIFLRNDQGRRPVYGGTEIFQSDAHWRDHLLFYEYFHGDNGAGLGASHQTGWTGLVAPLIQLFGVLDAKGQLQPALAVAPRERAA
jgi:hypothetical protein